MLVFIHKLGEATICCFFLAFLDVWHAISGGAQDIYGPKLTSTGTS